MRFTRELLMIGMVMLSGVFVGCSSGTSGILPPSADEANADDTRFVFRKPVDVKRRERIARSAAQELDKIARSVEQYGTVTISGASLIEPDPRFQLDLELTGNQIFERNRAEGFSNVSQFDSFDAQVSVKAEIVANMLDQMENTTDPKLFGQLRNSIMAAAFQTFADQLPEPLQPLADALRQSGQEKEKSTPPTVTNGEPIGNASDGGEGKLFDADRELAEAKTAFESASQIPDQIKEPEGDSADVTKEGNAELVERAQADVRTTVEKAKLVATDAADAARSARILASDVEAKFSTAPAAEKQFLTQATQFATDAKSKADIAIQAADDLVAKSTSDLDELAKKFSPELSSSDLKTVIEEYREYVSEAATSDTEKHKSAPRVVALAREAVQTARQAAATAGVPVSAGEATPQAPKQKILEADEIDVADRIALARIPKFRDVLSNFDGPLDLNLRQLLILTASDKMTLEMLRWLSYPRGFGSSKRVYLCMASVNVTPGRRTYKNYQGSVDLMMEYFGIKVDNGIQKRFENQHPVLFAAFPFVDSQVLNLRSSRRQAFSLAMQLVVNGYPAAARGLLDFARQREQDVETVTGVNTLSTYTTGNHIGFTFSPRLVAQGDPSDINTTPAMTLQHQTIPVVLMIICDVDDLKRITDEDYHPHLKWYQSASWRKVGNPRHDKWPFGETILDPLFTPRLSESDLMKRAIAADRARAHLQDLGPDVVPSRLHYRRVLEADEIVDRTKLAVSKAKEKVVVAKNKLGTADETSNKIAQSNATKELENAFTNLGALEAQLLEQEKQLLDTKMSFTSASTDNGAFKYSLIESRLSSLGAIGVVTNIYFSVPFFTTNESVACNGTGLEVTPRRGWVNRSSTFFVEADDPNAFADTDFVVSIGGRNVNATRLSDKVLKIVVPPWLDTFDFEDASAVVKSDRTVAQVVVSTGRCVYRSMCDNDGTGDGCIHFDYYAPTPRTAKTAPAKAPKLKLPVAKLDPGHTKAIDGDASVASSRIIKIRLSQAVDASEVALRLTRDGQHVELKQELKSKGGKVIEFKQLVDKKAIDDLPDAFVRGSDITDMELVFFTDGKGGIVVPVTGTLKIKRSKLVANESGSTLVVDANAGDSVRRIKIKLNREIKAQSGTLVLKKGDASFPFNINVKGHGAQLAEAPLSADIDKIVGESDDEFEFVDITLELTVNDKATLKAEFRGKINFIKTKNKED